MADYACTIRDLIDLAEEGISESRAQWCLEIVAVLVRGCVVKKKAVEA
jgi:hypothetical protein